MASQPGPRSRKFIARLAGVVCAISFFVSASFAQILHNPRRKDTVGFTVELIIPSDKLVEIVKQVAEDGVIRGTRMYVKQVELDGAGEETSSKAFTDYTGKGEVIYKVREGALSPANFPGSNDIGTVTVRYIVESLTPEKSRLRIDAIFVADRGPRYPSDGTVETAEYGEILTRVKAVTNPAPAPSAHAAAKPAAPDSPGLQDELAQDRERLEETRVTVQKLQQHEKQLEFNTMGIVKSNGVPLKASPYSHASNVVMLQKSEKVTVLTTTKYWYRIRREHGDEGWLYYVFLDPLPQ
jgi:hypothetical protein